MFPDPDPDPCDEFVQVGAVTRDMYDTLVGIQTEKVMDKYGWLYDPFADKQ